MTDNEFEFEHECPGCNTMATFGEGQLFGALQCRNCGFTPPASVREEIREQGENRGSEYP